tara:strand:- start:187 stop:393 length:207 start_codon:yes stop_codon:yes gene_type:complete
MGYLGKEQEQAIARSTRYLVAALLTTLMIFIAGLFLSAELEQQAVQKDKTRQDKTRQDKTADRTSQEV